MSIKTLITNLLNSLLDGSFERVRIINQMNAAFKECFTSGELAGFARSQFLRAVTNMRMR